MSLIKCENISFDYEGMIACKDLNFTVNAGDFLSVIGRNGAGKSTLIKGLLSLKSPSSGSITMAKDLKTNQIGYMPQQSKAQKDFPASVFEVVLSGTLNSLGMRAFYGKKEKAIAIKKMEDLGIINIKHKSYRDLSGGQQQRVLLARALASTKKILIMDEPVAGLDLKARGELYNIIERLNKEEGLTIIMVSHDLDGAVKLSNKILHLDGGQLFFGRVKDYVQTSLYESFMEDL